MKISSYLIDQDAEEKQNIRGHENDTRKFFQQ